ncbi:hypothetical protein [Haladaptatus caseinilyticus]|uniref:hypothetical protein n=1 Tax=Haladaptatus caseinilyticus TaxID=2993314 RepID=UPI00224B0281|nr:hypothetical protein [Haladaptatus caseinilyticus]
MFAIGDKFGIRRENEHAAWADESKAAQDLHRLLEMTAVVTRFAIDKALRRPE